MRARSIAFLIVAISAIAYTPLFGQARVNSTGTGGIHTVKGQVFTPADRRVDGQVTVRLQSLTYAELSLVTDQNGTFEFRSLAPGTYTVVVDAGNVFEVFHESVFIDPDVQNDPLSRVVTRRPRIYTVPVYLQLKRNAGEKPNVINAKMAAAPKDAVKRYEKGLDLIQEGKADAALAEFRSAVQIYPELAPAYVQMGTIYLRTGRVDEAVDVLGRAVQIDPQDFDGNVDYGAALFAKHDYAAAEAQLIKASQLNGTAVTPHYYLGILYFQTDTYDKAQTELENAKRLKGDKNFPLVHRYLGEVYRVRKMSKEAVAELETYLRIAPNAKDADHVRQLIADLKAKTN